MPRETVVVRRLVLATQGNHEHDLLPLPLLLQAVRQLLRGAWWTAPASMSEDDLQEDEMALPFRGFYGRHVASIRGGGVAVCVAGGRAGGM